MHQAAFAAVLLFSFVAAAAAAAAQSVAVMPFRDLSGSNKPVGEAIRESVTSDLRGVPQLRVVERAELDKVIAEQKLQGVELDADPLATVRIGKLLGADLMTVGAYQQAGNKIRLTARFVKVETGEVIGTAKVDGPVSDFLKLQDAITVELLRSARMSPQVVERFARRSRPKLRNIRAVELYGRAATERDEPMKAALLKEVVKEAPQFSYAQDDLSRLEKKLKELDAKLAEAQRVELEKARKVFAEAASPTDRWMAGIQLATQLYQQRRLHEALGTWQALAKAVQDPSMTATARAMEVELLFTLGREDEGLNKAEVFLNAHPTSPSIPSVRGRIERLIEERKRIAAGKQEVEKDLRELTGERRWDLCQLANLYYRQAQYPEAKRLFYGCLAAGTGDEAHAMYFLTELAAREGDWKGAREWMAALKESSPTYYQQMRGIELRIPTDG